MTILYEIFILNIIIWERLLEYPMWEFYIEYHHLRKIGWLYYMRIFHWISSYENCASLEHPDHTCLRFGILTARYDECQNKRVFPCLVFTTEFYFSNISHSQLFTGAITGAFGTFILKEECCFRHIFTLLESRSTFLQGVFYTGPPLKS